MIARNDPGRTWVAVGAPRRRPLGRLWRWVTGPRSPERESPCHCETVPVGGGSSLVEGDLHLAALALGFDETASARRTLEFHDPVLACVCPQDCIQHPWRCPA